MKIAISNGDKISNKNPHENEIHNVFWRTEMKLISNKSRDAMTSWVLRLPIEWE